MRSISENHQRGVRFLLHVTDGFPTELHWIYYLVTLDEGMYVKDEYENKLDPYDLIEIMKGKSQEKRQFSTTGKFCDYRTGEFF